MSGGTKAPRQRGTKQETRMVRLGANWYGVSARCALALGMVAERTSPNVPMYVAPGTFHATCRALEQMGMLDVTVQAIEHRMWSLSRDALTIYGPVYRITLRGLQVLEALR